MARPRVLVLRSPGTNCEQESAYSFDRVGGESTILHVNRVLESPYLLDNYQILCLPGGFSFGDDIASGRVFANKLDIQLADVLRGFVDRGCLVLGICNGFQVLLRSGLLSGAGANGEETPVATLALNQSGRYEDRWVHLRVDPSPCVFLRGISSMFLPVAHAEGRFVAKSASVFDQLEAARRLPLRYTAAKTGAKIEYPENPNGAQGHVAGMCDTTGRIFGLMPHPERHFDGLHHPNWTRQDEVPERGDGYALFANGAAHFQ